MNHECDHFNKYFKTSFLSCLFKVVACISFCLHVHSESYHSISISLLCWKKHQPIIQIIHDSLILLLYSLFEQIKPAHNFAAKISIY